MSANLKWRLIGLVLIALGVAAAWFFALGPLREAQAGAGQVSYEIKAFVAAPVAIVTGLLLILGGAEMGELMTGMPKTRRQKIWALTGVILAVAGGLAAYWWFDAELARLGYASAA